MEGVSLASPRSTSDKVLASRSSRIPIRMRKTSTDEKPIEQSTPRNDSQSKDVPTTPRKDSLNKDVPAPFVSLPKVQNSVIFVPQKNSAGFSATTASNKSACSVCEEPSPLPLPSFSLPRTRVKSSSSSSPVESQANLLKKKLVEETKTTFPVHELPNEIGSNERTNAWVDHSRASHCSQQTNEGDGVQDTNKQISEENAQQSPESRVILTHEDSVSIVHKSEGVSSSENHSENDMDMDRTMPALIEEPEELVASLQKSVSEKENSITSNNGSPIEVSSLNKDLRESISKVRPFSPKSSRKTRNVMTESEIGSSAHSMIPSGYGSGSTASVQSRVFGQQQRVPSFVMNQSLGTPSTSYCPPSRREISTVPSQTLPTTASSLFSGSIISRVTTARTKTYSKSRNTPTYEDLFYRKKALIAQGPSSAMRFSNQQAVPYSAKFTRNQPNFISQQQAAFTKVITETFTEYEVEDKCIGNQKNSQRSIKHRDGSVIYNTRNRRSLKKRFRKSKIPRVVRVNGLAKPSAGQNGLKAILPIQRNLGTGPIVAQPSVLDTIVEEPVEIGTENRERKTSIIFEDPEYKGHLRERSRSRPTKKVSMVRQWSPQKLFVRETENIESGFIENPDSITASIPTSGLSKTENNDSSISTLILAGHGNPHLEVPIQSNLLKEKKLADEDNTDYSYRKCATYKRLLKDSETTIRYLHQLLAIKEEKLEEAKSHRESVSGDGVTISKDNTEDEVKENETINRPSSHHLNPLVLKQQQNEEKSVSAIPKFDVDEFIRKWYRQMLSQDTNNDTFFQQSNLFRLSIATRAAICEDLRHQLKNGNHILCHKYDKLQGKIASNDPDSDAARIRLLGAYRRFVRYIHHYFDESLKTVEKFDEMYMAQSTNHENRKILYFHETTLNIGEERYYGVFVPIRLETQ